MIRLRLSSLLGDLQMSQSDFSKKVKIRPNTINAYYHGYIKRINIDDLNKICNALDCTIGELIEYIPDKNIKKPPPK